MSALVCLTYDDALPVHREVVAPLLAERGLRGTFFIPAARDDLHLHVEGWRKVAEMGHELGNHSCFHPCRTRADWDWKPPYRLEEYTRERIRDEVQLANRILHLIDGRTERSFGAPCSDLTIGPGEGDSFLEDLRDLFTVVRSGQCSEPYFGCMPFLVPALSGDFRLAKEIIAIIETMKEENNSWLIIGLHGVGLGTHNNYMDAEEHCSLLDWIGTQNSWLEAVTVLEAATELDKR